MSGTCSGCTKSFSRLNRHLDHCKPYQDLLGGGLKRRAEEGRAEREAESKRLQEKPAAEAERLRRVAEERAQEEAAREAALPVENPTFSRTGRQRRAPAWIRNGDMIPTSLAGLPEHLPRAPPPQNRPPPPTVEDAPDDEDPPPHLPPRNDPTTVDTPPNTFGVYRRYKQVPQYDPEEGRTMETFSNVPTSSRPNRQDADPLRPFGSTHSVTTEAKTDYFAPFLSASVFRLMRWFYSGSVTKSAGELDRLVNEVLLADDFNANDLRGFNAKHELNRLDKHTDTGVDNFPSADGWRQGSVRIPLPKTKSKHDSEDLVPTIEVCGIFYRPLLASIKAAYEDTSAMQYHHIPFRLYSQAPKDPNPSVHVHASSPGPTPSSSHPRATTDGNSVPASSPSERLYSEAYNTDALNRLNDAVQEKARADREPGDSPSLEYAVAGTMMYSDSMHLTNFGTASLWPIYFWLAALSKYVRAMPSMFAAHHLAYIPSLPDIINLEYENEYGLPPTAAVLRFCKKELMQQIWILLLDDDFLHAYVHGFVVECGDGIARRLFPRILTYSADYPEKCLIACIKFLGRCPCPDCLVTKDRIHLMGTKRDMATREKKHREDSDWLRNKLELIRGWIFRRGLSTEGKAVEAVLGATSTSANQSAFSRRLGQFGFNIYRVLVPDVMHEIELGVWKATMTHLVRILTTIGQPAINILNSRFASIPTFGRGTIRCFGNNVAALRKLAARDFEDLLQCAIPAFEGILPAPADRIVRRMLFCLATHHAMAKLRLHSDSTLAIFDHITRTLGEAMRAFASKVCPEYNTCELDKELAARQRRKAKKAVKRKASAPTSESKRVPTPEPNTEESGRVEKRFNLNTYKFHRAGDYVREIRETGTLDNTSTQTGELEHRRLKRFYIRTNKNALFASQIAKHQRRERFVNEAHGRAPKPAERKAKARRATTQKTTRPLQARPDVHEDVGLCSLRDHHRISHEQRQHADVAALVRDNEDDPAVKNFARDMRTHVLERLHAGKAATDENYVPSHEDRAALRIRHDRLYIHKRMLVNYTTYDMRRDQDSLNPSSHSDIMVLAPPGSSHPYLYGHILGIFHVNAYLAGRGNDEPVCIHMLWIRWYNLDTTAPWGLDACKLPRLEFAPLDDDPFGFLSPDQVLRAAHIIPAFQHGRSDAALPGYSIARSDDVDGGDDEDWRYYYIGIFSDRDMFMRYIGGGVGHQKTGVTMCSLFPSGGQSPANADTEAVQDGDEPMHDEVNLEPGADPSSEEDNDDGDNEDSLNDEEIDYGYVSSDDNDDDDDESAPQDPNLTPDGGADAGQGAAGDGGHPVSVEWDEEELGLDADEFEGFARP